MLSLTKEMYYPLLNLKTLFFMKINYKILSGILAILLVISVFCGIKTKYNKKPRIMNSQYHTMSDGTMMHNTAPMDHSMASMMMDMTKNMRGKSGAELEKSFITEMIPHHQGALDMANLLLEDKSINPKIKSFAENIITAQKAEIDQMNEWLKSY
jgi:uncharacterized protein (DUF305 family)